MKKTRVNIIDIAVILVVLLLIFVASVKFKNYNKSADGTDTTSNDLVYCVQINSIRDYTIKAFEVGDKVYDSLTNVEIGKIIDKQYVNSKTYEKLENGQIVECELPNRYDMTLTVETTGIINQTGYFANKTVELKVGSEKAIETRYVKTNGKITNLLAK